MVKTKLTEENLKSIIPTAISVASVLKQLGMSITSSNYRSFYRAINVYNLDTTHFLGQRHTLNTVRSKIPIDEILVEESSFSGTSPLKKRLLKQGLLKYECYECGISEWNNKKLSLQLDHINGIHNDNRIENLRLLCPNCHSQTDTYCGKNKNNIKQESFCECGNKKSNQSISCKTCNDKKREKVLWPEYQLLFDKVITQGYSTVAKELGVSRTSIKKRLKKFGALPVIRTQL